MLQCLLKYVEILVFRREKDSGDIQWKKGQADKNIIIKQKSLERNKYCIVVKVYVII